MVDQVKIFPRDIHEHGYYLKGGGFKRTDNSLSHSHVNRDFEFLGMRSVLYMGLNFECTSLFIPNTIPAV